MTDFIIAKSRKIFIMTTVIGVSSNGRTRDFGSLYHGSNPCAPTKFNKMPFEAICYYNDSIPSSSKVCFAFFES